MELDVHRIWNYVEFFWNSLDNAPSSIVFYLEMKVEVEVGVHDIRPRFTPRLLLLGYSLFLPAWRIACIPFCKKKLFMAQN